MFSLQLIIKIAHSYGGHIYLKPCNGEITHAVSYI